MTANMEKVNQYINHFIEKMHHPSPADTKGNLKVGVDLGTANIVLAVVDEENRPVGGAICPAAVVQDGLVVDYLGAVEIVGRLKEEVEAQLGVALSTAAGAVPPGTAGNDKKAIKNILEAVMFDVRDIIDEPTAASAILKDKNCAVVDVGGGTTGISILKAGEVIYTADEPTGGTHMTLTLSGYYDISFEKAEAKKKDKAMEAEVISIIQPVIEKMALITKKHISAFNVETIYIVGGSSSFTAFTDIFTNQIGIPCLKPEHPLFITPLGIALNS